MPDRPITDRPVTGDPRGTPGISSMVIAVILASALIALLLVFASGGFKDNAGLNLNPPQQNTESPATTGSKNP